MLEDAFNSIQALEKTINRKVNSLQSQLRTISDPNIKSQIRKTIDRYKDQLNKISNQKPALLAAQEARRQQVAKNKALIDSIFNKIDKSQKDLKRNPSNDVKKKDELQPGEWLVFYKGKREENDPVPFMRVAKESIMISSDVKTNSSKGIVIGQGGTEILGRMQLPNPADIRIGSFMKFNPTAFMFPIASTVVTPTPVVQFDIPFAAQVKTMKKMVGKINKKFTFPKPETFKVTTPAPALGARG